MKRIDKIPEEIRDGAINCACPASYGIGPRLQGPIMWNNDEFGCRGITCQECWNTEYTEDK